MKTIYEERGYRNRKHYITSLAEEKGVDEEVALTLANLLGPEEDFDGLVNALEDIAEGNM